MGAAASLEQPALGGDPPPPSNINLLCRYARMPGCGSKSLGISNTLTRSSEGG